MRAEAFQVWGWRIPFLASAVVLVLATVSFILAFTLFYTISTFCLSYGTTALKLSRTTMLVEAIIAAAVMGVATLWFAVLSDRVGRRKLCILAFVASAVWAFPLFWLMRTRSPRQHRLHSPILLVPSRRDSALPGLPAVYGRNQRPRLQRRHPQLSRSDYRPCGPIDDHSIIRPTPDTDSIIPRITTI